MSLWKAIQAADFGKLLQAVRQLPSWDSESATAVHNALVAWVERAMAAPMREANDSAAALYDLLGRLRAAHGDDALDAGRPGTAASWKAFEELLNERLAKLRHGDSQREAVLARRHVRDVIAALLRTESMSQRDLRDSLGVSEPIMSQVLTRMEAAMMVVRERDQADGRTRSVRLTEAERARVAGYSQPAQLVVAERPHRGLDIGYGIRGMRVAA